MGTEAAGTVATDGERTKILIIVGIVHLAEEGSKRVTLAKAFCQLTAGTCRRPHVVGVENGQFITLGAAHLIVHPVQLSTYHSISTVLAYLKVVGGNGIPHPAHGMLLLALHGRVGALHLTVLNGVSEEALFLLSIVYTEGCAYHEVLKRSDAEVHIAKSTPLGVLVVLRIVYHTQRVLTL